MQYLIIMGALIAVAVILIVIIIVALMKGKREDEMDYEEDGEEYEEEEEAEQEEVQERPRRKHRPVSEQGGHQQDEGPSVIGQDIKHQDEEEEEGPGEKRVPGKKLWKLVLENLGSW